MGRNQANEGESIVKLRNFLPKQNEAWDSLQKYTYVLYGGARGPGKSYWLRWSLLSLHLFWFMEFGIRNIHTGLFCETFPELKKRQISKINVEFPLWLGEVKSTIGEGLGFHIREEYGGGIIELNNLDDPSKYQSAEYAAIAVDELTKSTKEKFDILRGSKRWPGISRTFFLAATNPGGIGHLYVKDMWVNGDFTRYPEMKDLAKEFHFIKALPTDNTYLPPEYWEELNSLPPDLYRAWVEGDWDAFIGQAFSSWRRDKHVQKAWTLPGWWVRWRAIDWGFAKPFCCLWLAKDPDLGRIYTYREIYTEGLTDKQQAKAIVENTPPDENIQLTYADPSMWARKNVEDIVTTTADIYAKYGVPLTKADNDRLSGKRKMDRVLQNLPDGEPGLIVFENCRNLIRTIPALPYDKTRVEDVDTDAEDHAYDGLRYGLTRLVDPTKQAQEQILPWQRKMKSNLQGLERVL
jgi:hypothetical protein